MDKQRLKRASKPGNKIKTKDILKSVISAAFWVQKKKNHTRDFSHGQPVHFIIAGLVVTLLFIFILVAMLD